MPHPPLALPFQLHPSKGKHLGWALACAAFVAGGVLMILNGDKEGWFVAVVFAPGVLLLLVQLLPGASSLSVDTEGLEVVTTFRKKRFAWREIEGFGVYTVRQLGLPVGRFVGFNLIPGARKPTKSHILSKAMTGFEAGLPDSYGFKAEELAELLAGHHRDWAPRG